jgi:hypothetical protein
VRSVAPAGETRRDGIHKTDFSSLRKRIKDWVVGQLEARAGAAADGVRRVAEAIENDEDNLGGRHRKGQKVEGMVEVRIQK